MKRLREWYKKIREEKRKWKKDHSFVYGEKVETFIEGEYWADGTIIDKYREQTWDDYRKQYFTYIVKMPNGTAKEFDEDNLEKSLTKSNADFPENINV